MGRPVAILPDGVHDLAHPTPLGQRVTEHGIPAVLHDVEDA
jgi:hypothetical protein